MPVRHAIVIGGSTGALEALLRLLPGLRRDVQASVFVVIHTAASSPGVLPNILARVCPLPVAYAVDGEQARAGRVIVAPPDHHLLLEGPRVRVARGPRENGFRPAVDPLFRTAAVAYGKNAIGVVLSGGLSDGTFGLLQIKRNGGVAVVQDPDDALARSMPESAIAHVDVNHVVAAASLGALLMRLTKARKPSIRNRARRHAPDAAEVGTNFLVSGPEPAEAVSAFTCQECGGVLRIREDGGLTRFGCHVGHVYTEDALAAAQTSGLEHALWTALRTLEEGAAFRRQMAARAHDRGANGVGTQLDEQAAEWEARAATVRRALVTDDATGDLGSEASVEHRAQRARRG